MISPATPPRDALATASTRIPGESLVWLTAMGLSIGLAMVIGLLGLIVWNGIPVFWPKRLMQLEVAHGSTTQAWLGIVVKHQTGRHGLERQIYIGNKDVYNVPFRYFDDATVVGITAPIDAMLIERLEYGNALGYPLRLEAKGAAPMASADPAFPSHLRSLIALAATKRADIERLKQGPIGTLAHDQARLNLALSKLTSAHAPASQIADLRDQLTRINTRLSELAMQVRSLRSQQDAQTVILRLANGQDRHISVGQILDFYYPNALGFWQQSARFLGNIWDFCSTDPREANTEGGIFPAIFGTLVMTLLMSMAVMPFGVIAALYLREYARQGAFVRCVRIAVNNLAGVPSIVFGIFGLGFFVYIVGGSIDRLFYSTQLPNPTFGTGGIFWAALTLALMTVPVVIVATEEAIAAVPRGAREASLACGASKWQTIQSIVLPSSLPGILTGLILAMARGAGEVAPLMLVGVVKLAPSLPIDGRWNDTDVIPFVHLDQKFMHLGYYIFDLGFQSPDSDAAKPMVFATTLFLIALILVLNLTAIILREKLRRRFATAAF